MIISDDSKHMSIPVKLSLRLPNVNLQLFPDTARFRFEQNSNPEPNFLDIESLQNLTGVSLRFTPLYPVNSTSHVIIQDALDGSFETSGLQENTHHRLTIGIKNGSNMKSGTYEGKAQLIWETRPIAEIPIVVIVDPPTVNLSTIGPVALVILGAIASFFVTIIKEGHRIQRLVIDAAINANDALKKAIRGRFSSALFEQGFKEFKDGAD